MATTKKTPTKSIPTPAQKKSAASKPKTAQKPARAEPVEAPEPQPARPEQSRRVDDVTLVQRILGEIPFQHKTYPNGTLVILNQKRQKFTLTAQEVSKYLLPGEIRQ